MGYEIRIYIGERSRALCDDDNGDFFQPHAMIDLCKVGSSPLEQLSYEVSDKPVYFYAEDGNTRISKDRYDKVLTSFPLNDVLAALKKNIKADKQYRRYIPALALLESFTKYPTAYGVECVFYGY